MSAVEYRQLFAALPGLYLILSPRLIILDASDEYLAATMTQRDKIVGSALFDVFPDNPADSSADGVHNLRASLERVSRYLKPDVMPLQKYDIRKPSELGGEFEERFWSPVNAPVLDETGKLKLIIHRVEDVSEFVRLQNQNREKSEYTELLQLRMERLASEVMSRSLEINRSNQNLRELNLRLLKLQALGRFTVTIVHDFNNLLGVITGYAEMLGDRMTGDARGAEFVREISGASRRAAQLTKKLLAFGRSAPENVQNLDVRTALDNMKSLLERLLGDKHILQLEVATQDLTVKADHGQVEQMLMNLILNARDAMPAGGRVTLCAKQSEPDECSHDESPVGPHVMIEVRDEGVGMDDSTRARIFEPFFTTKGTEGNGIGLATVLELVNRNGGSLQVTSALGSGSRFKICFPRSADSI